MTTHAIKSGIGYGGDGVGAPGDVLLQFAVFVWGMGERAIKLFKIGARWGFIGPPAGMRRFSKG